MLCYNQFLLPWCNAYFVQPRHYPDYAVVKMWGKCQIVTHFTPVDISQIPHICKVLAEKLMNIYVVIIQEKFSHLFPI